MEPGGMRHPVNKTRRQSSNCPYGNKNKLTGSGLVGAEILVADLLVVPLGLDVAVVRQQVRLFRGDRDAPFGDYEDGLHELVGHAEGHVPR